jgi:hypothetical protein
MNMTLDAEPTTELRKWLKDFRYKTGVRFQVEGWDYGQQLIITMECADANHMNDPYPSVSLIRQAVGIPEIVAAPDMKRMVINTIIQMESHEVLEFAREFTGESWQPVFPPHNEDGSSNYAPTYPGRMNDATETAPWFNPRND